MRLYERHRPATLADIIGQPHVTGPPGAYLCEPYPNIIMLEGPTGTRKTACAMALSSALADTGWFGGTGYAGTGAPSKPR